MKIRYFWFIIGLLILVGCTEQKVATPEGSVVQNPETVEEPAIVEEGDAAVEKSVETVGEPSDLEVRLTANGFETNEMKVAKGSRITIVNDASTMHKINGGDLFKTQFNTHLKSLYGGADPLGRNKLAIGLIEAGEFEIKDLTTNNILKVTVE